MKRWHFLIIALLIITGTAFLIRYEGAVAPANSYANNNRIGEATNPEDFEGHVDARYRGIYDDRGENQVTIQFYLEDDHFYDISFRQLKYDDVDYHEPEKAPEDYAFATETLEGMAEQYESAIGHLEGEHISRLTVLHNPGDLNIEPEEIDGMSAATIRGSKLVSAIRDALNRGAYDNIEE